MKNEMLREKLQGLLLENVEYLITVVEELNSWNGNLDYLRTYINDEEFFGMFFQGNPMEVARAIYYGYYKYNVVYAKEMFDSLQKFNGIVWSASIQFVNEKYQLFSSAIDFNEILKFRAELL